MLSFYKPAIDGAGTYNKEVIQKYVIDKFIPYESTSEAKIHINTKISNNTHQSIGTSISDFFHYYNKEFKFNITKRFKSGGEVEVGKGKDYIKDLI